MRVNFYGPVTGEFEMHAIANLLPSGDLMPYTERANILIVEDNPANQLVTSMFVSELGCQSKIVENGEEAVAEVQANDYDVVLMDLNMPIMDGLHATKLIRAMGGKFASLPIIAVTANALSDSRDECFDAGMNEFVSKPVDKRVLLDTITKFIEFEGIDGPRLATSRPDEDESTEADAALKDILKDLDS